MPCLKLEALDYFGQPQLHHGCSHVATQHEVVKCQDCNPHDLSRATASKQPDKEEA